MNCPFFEKFENGEISPGEFERHCAECPECPECAEMLLKDQNLMEICANLNENIDAPDLWGRLERQILKDDEIVLKRRQRPYLAFKYLSLAAVFLFVALTLVLHFIATDREDGLRVLSEKALRDVLKSEQQYMSAIDKLENIAEKEISRIDPQLSELYRVKLETIDRQIEKCQAVLAENPANRHMRQYLLAALQDKKQTLRQIVNNHG